jgi:hypothetical protein
VFDAAILSMGRGLSSANWDHESRYFRFAIEQGLNS